MESPFLWAKCGQASLCLSQKINIEQEGTGRKMTILDP